MRNKAVKSKNSKTSQFGAEDYDRILDQYQLKKTALRRALLARFLNSTLPLSQADLLQALGDELESVDRVSVYRNLNQMKDAGLVHEVDVNSYVACSHECSHHPHLLLFCRNCQRHREVSDHEGISQLMSAVKSLRFFNKDEALYLKGLCEDCSSGNKA